MISPLDSIMLPLVVLVFTGSIACLIICLLIRVYLCWNFNYWNQRNVRGPTPQLFTGTFPKTTASKCNLMEELHEIYMQYKGIEKFVGIFTARSPKLFILDPKLATTILIQHFKNFHDNESSQWTSPKVEQMRLCSPFVSTGDSWKERRAELLPALTTNRLRNFYTTMRDCADKLVTFIEYNGLANPIDAKELSNRYTTQFMANFIWGTEADAFAKPDKLSTLHQMGNSIISQALACVHYYGRTAAWPWLRKIKPVRFFPANSDRFFQQLTADALHLRSQSKLLRCDVIDHLEQLKCKKSLNDIQIAGHSTTVLIDGFETGAIVITHCLLLLSRDKRVQEKLRQELFAAGNHISYDELNELPYLDQCLQESLRIFPPLPTQFKLCTVPITLEDTCLSLEPGDVVYISSYSFQHDPDYYEDPDKFWPERFDADLGGIQKYRDLGVFLPFGDGPRMCPGLKLGLAEAKVAIAALIRDFQLSSGENTRKDNKLAPDSFLLTLDSSVELIFHKL